MRSRESKTEREGSGEREREPIGGLRCREGEADLPVNEAGKARGADFWGARNPGGAPIVKPVKPMTRNLPDPRERTRAVCEPVRTRSSINKLQRTRDESAA
jgi:hypothetical protein